MPGGGRVQPLGGRPGVQVENVDGIVADPGDAFGGQGHIGPEQLLRPRGAGLRVVEVPCGWFTVAPADAGESEGPGGRGVPGQYESFAVGVESVGVRVRQVGTAEEDGHRTSLADRNRTGFLGAAPTPAPHWR
ncbi:hypothetical protein GCM10009647_047830 [Streptomyces sanglieri]